MKHKVSVIIPSFNRERFIVKTIESVQMQDYKNWECIIVDDGSTDDTISVVSTIAAADSRIKLYQRPSHLPKGANACRNYGFEQSSGKYINWLDSDDLIGKYKFTEQIKALEESNFPFSICQTSIFDVSEGKDIGLRCNKIISPSPLDDYIQFNIFWSIHAVLWKRSTIASYRFNQKLQQSQEYEYHIRLLKNHHHYHSTNRVLATIITHSDNMSNSSDDRMDKFLSNLDVRFWILRDLRYNISPETRDHVFTYFNTFYKKLLLKRQFLKAIICLKYIWKSIDFIDQYKNKKFLYFLIWSLALPSYFLFNRGMIFLKILTYRNQLAK